MSNKSTVKEMHLPRVSLGAIFLEKLKKTNPNKIFLIENNTKEEITCSKLLETSTNLAISLQNLKITKDDVIMIISPNRWEILTIILSCFYIGARVMLLNYEYTAVELAHFFEICPPKLVFSSSNYMSKILSKKITPPPLLIAIDAESDNGNILSFSSLVSKNTEKELKLAEIDVDNDVAIILSSSGTTGLPKCVLLTHTNFRTTLMYCGDENGFEFSNISSTILHVPMFHALGFIISLSGILYEMKIVIMQKFNPRQYLKAIQNFKINTLVTVPSVLLFLAKDPLIEQFDVSSVREITFGGSKTGENLHKLISKRFRNAQIREGYGMTEAGGLVTFTPKYQSKSGSVGIPFKGFSVIICDENDKALENGEIGEIRLKSEGCMKGYCNNEEQTKQAFDKNGFLKTGDLGYCDKDGFFFIIGRIKEIIKYKSFSISPAEVENLLIKHEAVEEVAVTGVPHPRDGELLLALVVKARNKEVSAEEIQQFVRDNISRQKWLYGGVVFVDSIPKNAFGKVLRRQLRELVPPSHLFSS